MTKDLESFKQKKFKLEDTINQNEKDLSIMKHDLKKFSIEVKVSFFFSIYLLILSATPA